MIRDEMAYVLEELACDLPSPHKERLREMARELKQGEEQ